MYAACNATAVGEAGSGLGVSPGVNGFATVNNSVTSPGGISQTAYSTHAVTSGVAVWRVILRNVIGEVDVVVGISSNVSHAERNAFSHDDAFGYAMVRLCMIFVIGTPPHSWYSFRHMIMTTLVLSLTLLKIVKYSFVVIV